jgi:SDR family mycofactocin-dependent oxidoreductase
MTTPERSTRVAVVTGAARGVGAAIVARLNRDGWAVVAVDRCADDPAVDYPLATPEQLSAMVDNCVAPAQVISIVADVRDEQALHDAGSTAVKEFGGLDAGVAAAGVIVGGPPLWEIPETAYRAAMEVNLDGVWRLARATIPLMLERPEPRHGRFVAVASAAAHRAMPRLGAYAAAKAGVVGLVRGLAADLAGSGVTANGVSPGSTTTAMLAASADIYQLDGIEAFAQHHLQARLLHPEEIAAAVAWLFSPESSALTGSVLRVDGGLTA